MSRSKRDRTTRSVEPQKKLPERAKRELPFDALDEAELPAYQQYLAEVVTAAQQDPAAAGLGAKQIALAFVMTDPRVHPRTVSHFCRVADCDRSLYYLTYRNPRWIAFKNALAKQLTEAAYDDAMTAMQKLVKQGNVQALRLYFELRGDLVHRTEDLTKRETPEERMKRMRVAEVLEEKPAQLPSASLDDDGDQAREVQ